MRPSLRIRDFIKKRESEPSAVRGPGEKVQGGLLQATRHILTRSCTLMLDFQPLELGETKVCSLSPPGCGILLQPPELTNTGFDTSKRGAVVTNT